MGKLDEATNKSKELEQNLKGAAEASSKVAKNAKNLTEETDKSKKNVSEMSQVASNTTFEATISGLKQVRNLGNTIVSIWSHSIAWEKLPKQFDIRMAEINRKMKYAGIGLANFGSWRDLDFRRLHLKELRMFDIAAQASGSTAKNVKALEYSMRKFGGTAQEALQWTRKMQYSLADMEWGGEGGVLGQVAFEYGLDFTGAETEKEIDEKIANLLDTLPKRQQVRVAQMLGLSDSNFMRLTEKDANGNLTLKSTQEWAEQEAKKTVVDKNLQGAREATVIDAVVAIKEEQGKFTIAVSSLNSIIKSAQETINKLPEELAKVLDDKKFNRDITQQQNEVDAEFTPREHKKSMFSTAMGFLGNTIDIGIKTYATKKVLEKLFPKLFEYIDKKVLEKLGQKILEKTGQKVLEKAGQKVLEKTGQKVLEKAGPRLITNPGLVAPLIFAGMVTQSNMYGNYLKNGADRSKLTWFQKNMIGSGPLKVADIYKKKNLADTADRVHGAIERYKEEPWNADLLTGAWQHGFRPVIGGDPAGDSLKELNDFIRTLTPSQARDVMDAINWKDPNGRTRGYRIDPSTLDLLMRIISGTLTTSESADEVFRDAGVNVSSANAAAATAPSISSLPYSIYSDSHDSIIVKVENEEQVGPTIASIKKMQQEKVDFYLGAGSNEQTSGAYTDGIVC